jgi:uncharacterized protein YfaS (alpha-2-macroglobulin family)
VSLFQSIRSVSGFLGRVLAALFGDFRWSAPSWLRYLLGNLRSFLGALRRNPGRVAIVLGLVAAVGFSALRGYKWYQGRPKPVEMSVRLDAPEPTKLEDNAKPDTLRIIFGGSAAPIDKVKKPVTAGIELDPAVPGSWKWDSDRVLTFTPKEDWPIGESFVVTLDRKGLLTEGVRLHEYELKFQSAPLTISMSSTEFYQDPQDQNHKKVVSTVSFSHAIEPAEFERHLSMELISKKEGQKQSQPYRFQVTYDKLHGNAFVHSDPVRIPDHDATMLIRVGAGVKAAHGGKPTTKEVVENVNIPGLYDFLRVREANLTLVNNAQYEPEQVLILETNTGVQEAEMRKAVTAYVLPVQPPGEKTKSSEPHAWGVYEISPEVLRASQPLKLEQIANERDYATVHSFRYQAEVGRYVYVRIAKGMRSFGGYLLGEEAHYALRVPEFPKELKIMQNGALLSLTGEKKLSLYARDVESVRVEVDRVLPGQLHHLVGQNNGSFQNPEFYNYRFSAENISEILSEVIDIPLQGHGKAQYAAVDLGKYLDGKGEDRKGLFFVKVESWDTARKINTGKTDNRLVLLTDLGMLVKDNADGTHEVFVQSLDDGAPVRGAKVELIGKNGVPVLTQATDGEGHAAFPKLTGYTREQTPLMYLVRKGADLSFMPFGRSDRYLDFSRFPIDGVTNSEQPQGLTAYMFSDRGIYRPGDEIRVGLIVKSRDWRSRLAGVPLEITVEDARGMTVKRDKIKLTEAGFEEIRYLTADSSPTGTWNINVHVVKDDRTGSLLGSTSVRVQEFLPDRLKMTARLASDKPSQKADTLEGWVTPESLKAHITLLNLFGTPATARRVKASIQLSPTLPTFSRFADYQFSDPLRAKEAITDSLADGETDDKGEAEFDLNLSRFAAATYRLRFLAQGFEAEGGRSVAAEAAVTVSPLQYLVGYKTDGDLSYVSKGQKRAVDLVAIGPSASRVAQSGIRAQLLERRYLSVLTKQYNGTYKYESIKKEVPLTDKHISIPESGLRYELPSDKAGDFVLLLRNDKDQELSRIEFTVAGEGNLSRSLEKNAELHLQLKSADVGPGDELELQIKAPYTGSGLITIERDKVLSYKWFRATTTSTIQTIQVPPDMEGNGYVSVSFIRGLSSGDVFMSPLSYGVAPFSLSRARRTAKITVNTPELVKPGEPLKLRYSTDRPTKIVLFAVDEGILQVAKYKTPDPLAYFFQKRALEVKTAQILDLVLPEFTRLMSAAPGGDSEGGGVKNLNPFKRRRDKPVAYWSGIIDAGPREREVVYDVPDSFNGTLRVMAVAVAADAVGVLHKKTQVRGDFVLSPNVPTFAAPGDQFEVSVGVANNVVGSGKNPNVNLELKVSKHLEVIGAAKVSLPIGELRETVTRFTLKATSTLGSGSLTFVASLGNKSGKYTTDLSIRPAAPLLTTTQLGQLAAGGGKQVVAVPRVLYADYRQLSASLSPLPLGLSHGLVRYLEKFPHGCTEQQVSQGFPAVVLRTRPEFGYVGEAADKSFASVLATLRSRQSDEGGFGLWQNPNPPSDFASVYAMHFLVEARERGFAVPPEVWKKGLEYLGQLASRETDSLPDERLRAYAVYVLTRSGVVTSQYAGSVQKTLEHAYKGWQKDLAGIYLAATFKLLKQERPAGRIIAEAKLGQLKDADSDYQNYYDPLIRDAQLLYLLARHFPDRVKDLPAESLTALVEPIAQSRYNTLSSAYTILALDAYAQLASATIEPGQLGVAEILQSGQQRPLAVPAGILPLVLYTPDAKKLLLSSQSPLRTFYQVTQSGFDTTVPDKPESSRLEVFREIVGADGKPVTSVALGEEVQVHIKLRSKQPNVTLYNLALVDLLPGGFEVVIQPKAGSDSDDEDDEEDEAEDKEVSGDDEGGGDEGGGDGDGDGEGGGKREKTVAPPAQLPITQEGSTWSPEYGDVREDRVVLYGSVGSDVQEFVYSIKATNVGTYVVPPLQGESMYDRTVLARSVGGRITVIKNK